VIPVQEEIEQIHSDDAIIILEGMKAVLRHNNLGEGIVDVRKGSLLLSHFFRSFQTICERMTLSDNP